VGVSLEVEGRIGIVTLDDPGTRNALTHESARELVHALEEADRNPDLCAVVLRGANGTFCSGADRSLLGQARQDAGNPSLMRSFGEIYRAFVVLGNLSVPSIAAVRGAAVGAGANLFLAADVRIVADDARLVAGFLRIGLHPGGGHFLLSERAVGPQATVAMSLLGEEVRGPRMVELGLAWESLPDDQVEARALELAHRCQDPELVREATMTFRAQSQSRQLPWHAALRAEQAAQFWSFGRGSG
jgi:enoyl-CoA hydratase